MVLRMPTEIFSTQNLGPVTYASPTHGVRGPARTVDKSLSAPFTHGLHRWEPGQDSQDAGSLPKSWSPESTAALPVSSLPKAQTNVQGAAGTKVVLTWKGGSDLPRPPSPSVAIERPLLCMYTHKCLFSPTLGPLELRKNLGTWILPMLGSNWRNLECGCLHLPACSQMKCWLTSETLGVIHGFLGFSPQRFSFARTQPKNTF